MFLEKYKNEIYQLCRQCNINELYVFGSVLTDKFNQDSDVDVLVDFDVSTIKDYFSNYMDFKEQMEKLLSKKMDIVENQAVKNPIFRKILDRNKVLFYARNHS